MNKKYLITLIAAGLFGSVQAGAQPKDSSALQKVNIVPELHGVTHYQEAKQVKAQQEIYYIVRLQQQPMAAMGFASASGKTGNSLNMQSVQAKAHIDLLAQERATFATQLKAKLPVANIERHYDTVINAVVVRSKTNIFNQLQSIAGVSKVFKNGMRDAHMDASPSLINATQIWEQMGGKENAGKGIKVAIVDTGIRPEHPMFVNDEGFEASESLPGDDYCSTVADFCNNKLIVARSATPTFTVHEDEHMSPLGYGSHGSHVAGTAVGNHVNATFSGVDVELSGIAPGAYLMAYKGLFTTPTGGGSGSDVMLLEMLDWAVKDGADVINNSWGGGAGGDPADSVYSEVFQTAENAGVVVVTSAGNSGSGAQTIGCPSCIESGITVANTFHGRFFANGLTFGDLEETLAIQSVETSLTEDLTGTVVSSLSVDEVNFEGCSAFAADSFSGSIALISRGSCTFEAKVDNATDAGATAVIVYNNNASAPFSMFLEGTTIPSVMISQASGQDILDTLTVEVNQVTVDSETKAVIDPTSVDTMTASSSRGPNGEHNSLKPDIAAPGQSILSAVSPDEYGEQQYDTFTGTSMSAPHVAGAAAIMQQMYPEWSAIDIKTALTSTSKSSGLLKEDYETPVDPFDVGAGRLDLATATVAAVTFDKPSMAMNPCIITCDFTRTMNNKMAEETTWTATITFDDENISGEVSPSSLTLAAMGTEGSDASFGVNVNASNSDAEGWQFGQITWTDSSGAHPVAHMPIAVAIDASTMVSDTNGNTVNGTSIPMFTSLQNTGNAFDQQVSISINAPAGTNFVADSESSTLSDASEILLDHDEAANKIAWTGQLNPSQFLADAYPGGFGLPSLADLAVLPQACADGCDEIALDFNLGGLSFEYAGQRYSQFTVSDNGLIIAGGGSTAGTWNNQELPSATAPNNVIAPFWSDFDLNSDGADSGGGDIYVAIFDLGPALYLAIEWKDAQLWNDVDGKQYTFQVWLSLGETQDIFFQHLALDATLPENLTVGAEDASGTQGVSFHYNGGGYPIAPVLAVQLGNTPSGSVSLGYELEVNAALELGVADTVEMTEDGSAETIEPLTNDNTSDGKVVDISFTHDGNTYYTPKTIDILADGELDATTLAIVSEPGNGTVVNNGDGTVDYTPDANFSGADSFTYDVADAAGNRMAATTVTVNVAAVNDAPTLTAGANGTGNENEGATVSVTGEDIDGDELTYTWTQTSGTNVGATSTSDTLTFTVPPITADETVTFDVVASDGTDSSNTVTVSVNMMNTSSGSGSFGWLLLLLPFAFGRRLRK